ncbi:MAG: type IV secretory system conjugative DNA transfer family protein [Candidatus Taylorbacteria bacterium]|nr:type IV secretory system conjugative DNA transfer family protein [Candidatus Taylorbacteria bacterium]
MNDDEKVVYFGETDARNRRVRFGIKKKDRSRHLYAIGKTGMGKSTLLESLAIQDIQNGDGVCFMDPHGKSADLLLEYVPEHRIKDVIYFAPFDMEYPISFNVMEDVGPEQRYLVASGMMSAFKKIWVDAWSARMEYILGNIMLALLEYPGSTLVGVNRMLTDKEFRKEVVNHISDPSVKSFWVNEYANYTDKFAAEAAPAIQNKVGQFVANPLIRNIIGQAKSSFDIRDVMDNKKILIINLSKGRVGEANANLLGSMLITKIYLGAMSRADLNEKQLAEAPNFYLYVDEFQSFANESFADILSEARKYKLNLHIAHQYIEQMTEEVRAAVFGNVGTMCIFRVGAYDAEVLEKEFAPQFTAEDIVNLQKYQMYLKLMIDGVTSPPFSAAGMPPIPKPEKTFVKEIIDSSRSLYARPRQQVEEELLSWIQTQFGKSQPQGGGGGNNNQQSRQNQSSSQGQNRRPEGQKPQFQGSREARGPQQQPQQRPPQQQRNSKDNTERANARENKLREAMSLSYLKPEVEEDKKAPKPENLSALRDALLSVMKSAPASQQQEEVKTVEASKPDPVVEHKKSDHVIKQQEHHASKHVHVSKKEEVAEDVLRSIFND